MNVDNVVLLSLNQKGPLVEECYFSDDPALKAITILGLIYKLGRGIEKPIDVATKLFQIAAEKEEKEAQYQLAIIYEETNHLEAMKWHEKAARQGHPLAMYRLGVQCILDEKQEEANAYLSAIMQYKDARIFKNLGILYENGMNQILADLTKAVEMFQKAAELGDVYSKWRLGVMYEYGKGVEKNLSKAFQYYTQAADDDFPDAQNNLGVLYCKGEIVEQDYKKARTLFLLAAEQNNANAMSNLAKLYAGPLYDEAKAKEWAEKAQISFA